MREQGARLMKVSWVPLQWRMRWPWTNHREQKKRIKEEYQRRRKQLNDLCLALKTDSLSDLQDLLCCMVLSECVYKVSFLFNFTSISLFLFMFNSCRRIFSLRILFQFLSRSLWISLCLPKKHRISDKLFLVDSREVKWLKLQWLNQRLNDKKIFN